MTDARSRKPHLPPTALVWCVRLAKEPPTRPDLVVLARQRWGAHYYVKPNRTAKLLDFCVARGWLTIGGPGTHAKVREAEGSRFMLEHDPTLLRGHDRALSAGITDTMQAWRRAHPEATTR